MLRITRQSDYGIVLMTLFSRNHADVAEIPVLSARDMAQETNLPLPTVSKILKALTRSGILGSRRGVKGGYTLTRPVEEISVADVIEAIEGPIAMTDCVEETGRDCIIQDTCPCTENWKRVNMAVREALTSIPLSQMNSACRFDPEAITDELTAPAELTEPSELTEPAEPTGAGDTSESPEEISDERDGQHELA